jgi:hypothetical protein
MADLRTIFETKYERTEWQTILREYFGANAIYEKPKPIGIKNTVAGASAVELGNF